MSIAQATVNSDLPPGTRLVLEIPDPLSPSGYRVETPTVDAFVAALAPAVVAEVRTQRQAQERLQEAARVADAAPSVAPPAAVPPETGLHACSTKAAVAAPHAPVTIMQTQSAQSAPVCPKCGRRKTIKPGGKNYTCTPCNSKAVSAGHFNRRAEPSRKAA